MDIAHPLAFIAANIGAFALWAREGCVGEITAILEQQISPGID